jgi:hypothetical protein
MLSESGRVALLLTTLCSACLAGDVAPPEGEVGPDAGATAVPFLHCPDWGCGENAASMGNLLPFHEGDASGEFPNGAGLCFQGMMKPDGTPLTMIVVGDRLIGLDRLTRQQLEGLDLVGSSLLFEHADWQPGQRCQDTPAGPRTAYVVEITDAIPINFWVNPECGPCFWSYVFKYGLLTSTDRAFLCKERVQLHAEWGMLASQAALVFTGDRYSAPDKLVTATGIDAGSWFNVACAGTAVAKMHLLRHTEAGILPASSFCPERTTSREERTAMLKMITDDICGTGHSFTRDGKDVFYMDRQGFHPFNLREGRPPEAIWTESGAVCVTQPRLQNEDPGTLAAIANECPDRLVPCDQYLPDWPQYGYGYSANNGRRIPHAQPSWPQCPASPDLPPIEL